MTKERKGARGGKPQPPEGDERDRALYVISVAAELAGVHPQTLRMYERRGLLRPARTEGRARRYSMRDIEHVRLIQTLTQEQGMNLAGVDMVMEMTRRLDEMRDRVEQLRGDMARMQTQMQDEVEKVRRSYRADLVPLAQSNAIVPFRRTQSPAWEAFQAGRRKARTSTNEE